MKNLEFVKAVKEGKKLYGTMLSSTSPVWLREIARTGADFIFVDTEHMPVDRTELTYICLGLESAGLANIVRVPSYEPLEICKALDSGACGIMAPYTETKEQVEALIKAVKYRPLKGKLLEDVFKDKNAATKETLAFIENKTKSNLLFLNIESAEGIKNLPELIKYPEVDGVIVGPHDLSVNLGIPEEWDNPVFDEAIKKIIDITRSAGKTVGNHYSFGIENQLKWAEYGQNMILHTTDINTFVKHIKDELDSFKTALGDSSASDGDTLAI